MGTNYYLKYKCKPNLGFNTDDYYRQEIENKVKELTNGYVWNNTYYNNIIALNKAYYRNLHIGKFSCGWSFCLCLYKDLGINSLEDWQQFFDKYEIVDEYGNTISKEEMIDTITNIVGEETREDKSSFCYENDCCYDEITHLYCHKTYYDFKWQPHEKGKCYDMTYCVDFS